MLSITSLGLIMVLPLAIVSTGFEIVVLRSVSSSVTVTLLQFGQKDW